MADHGGKPNKVVIQRPCTSLSEAQTELMRMWNEHRSYDGDIAISEIPASMESFIDVNGIKIWELNLYPPLLMLLEQLRVEQLISTEWKNEMIKMIRVSW